MVASKSSPGAILARALIRFGMLLVLFPAILFGSAGTLDWPMGWAYIIVSLAFVVGGRIVLVRRSPDLALERARSGKGAKEWDKPLVMLVAVIGPLAALVVAGLDHRFGWSPDIPLGVQVAALALTALATLFSTWAMLENRFFSGIVRIQKERGHHVIDTGPYRFVRHPGYLGGVIANLAGPLALGSLWALVAGVLLIAVTVYRTWREDHTLQEELDGYREYAQRVRYRLLPGVW